MNLHQYLLPFFLLFHLIVMGQIEIDPVVLQKAKDDKAVDCLIYFKNQPDLSAARNLSDKLQMGRFVYHKLRSEVDISQKRVRAFLDANALSYQSFFVVNAIRIYLPSQMLQQLEGFSEIAKVLPNLPIHASFPVETSNSYSKSAIEWGIDKIGARDFWDLSIKGKGVVVGGQDTGYDWSHPALQGSYRGNNHPFTTHDYHWHDAIHAVHPQNSDTLNPCGFNSNQPCDDNNHGTHTMGTMTGLDGLNQIGLAPEAQWIGCRNMERGWGLPSTYIECFEWFLAPTNLQGLDANPDLSPHVINNSWSCPTIEGCVPSNFEAMRVAVSNLRQAGIVVIVSAGNEGPACGSIATPAAIFDASITVGATNVLDSMAAFSSRGPVTIDASNLMKPDICAPGVNIRSCVPDSQYANYNGTSMAGPHVAGAIALLISANPEWAGKVEWLEELIKFTAKPIGINQVCGNISGYDVPNHVSGWGRIDLKKALAFVRPDLLQKDIPSPISIFPNPVISTATLFSEFEMGDVDIKVFNAQGQLVWQQASFFQRMKEIDFSALPNATYLGVISQKSSGLSGLFKFVKKS